MKSLNVRVARFRNVLRSWRPLAQLGERKTKNSPFVHSMTAISPDADHVHPLSARDRFLDVASSALVPSRRSHWGRGTSRSSGLQDAERYGCSAGSVRTRANETVMSNLFMHRRLAQPGYYLLIQENA